MDIRQYHLNCQIKLRPVGNPGSIVTFNDKIVYAGKLSDIVILSVDENLPMGTYQLSVELNNKSDTDPTTAIVVEDIVFNGIQSPKFVWGGVYQPKYPEPWASKQENLQSLLKNHSYLGWNGKWTLTFDVPVFTWIHQIEDLGWIYS